MESLEKIGNNLSSPSMRLPAIETNKIYYWHVVAHTINGDIQGAYWWFKVGAKCYALTVNKSGYGICIMTSYPAGINCGSTCSASYKSNTAVALTVTPTTNSVFTGWSGDTDCADGQVTMNADKTCLATCNLKTQNYTLTITKEGTGNGTVTSLPQAINCGSVCSAKYDQGKLIILTAQPNQTSVFAGWSGGGCTGTGICIITLNADTTITTTFTAIQANNPKTSAKPTSLNFGSMKAGSTSNPKTIIVKNTGEGSLIIDSINITGANTGNFGQINSCAVISPGGSCTILVTFSPTLPFGKKSAIISISSNDPEKPIINIKLSGQASPPKISVSSPSQ